MQISSNRSAFHKDSFQVLILICAFFFFAGYLFLRYEGRWAENDTAAFSRYIRWTIVNGRLTSETASEDIYANGYGYPVLGATISLLSGIPVNILQTFLATILAAWVVLPAWLTYREFTNSGKIATLATALLLIQPEFLFTLIRGSHEKFTRGLMFFALYVLLRSIRSRRDLRSFTTFLVFFYLICYGLITFNNLMAFSFIAAIGIALLLFGVINWRNRSIVTPQQTEGPAQHLSQRLLVIISTLIIIVFLFTFYAYPPAQHQLRLMASVQDQVASLLLQVGETPTNPYEVINAGWISLPVYLLVSLANWLLLIPSICIFTWQSYQYFFRRQQPSETKLLLWAFYGAFALQGALSIIIDLSGAIASNLQHRTFPSMVMLASPLVAQWIFEYGERHTSVRRPLRITLAVLVSLVAILSIFKATNEPFLSNNWIFYRPSEIIGLKWALKNNKSSQIWTDFNERVSVAYITQEGNVPNSNIFDIYTPKPATSAFLISTITKIRSQRLGRPLPINVDSLRVYDNGETVIYHRRPTTPFQK